MDSQPSKPQRLRDNISFPDDEIDLKQLLSEIWPYKWIVLLTTALFATAGLGYAVHKTDVYKASALLAPAESDKGARLSGQLGSLASLAGVNLGQGGSRDIVIAKEVLQSRAFLTDFIRRHDLEPEIIAGSGWNASSNEWIYDRKMFDPDSTEWGVDQDGQSLQPTDWDLVQKFKDQHLALSENRENGLITVSIKSHSPVSSKRWVDLLVQDINEHMRAQDIKEAEASIKYLKGKLNETTIAGMQQIFYQLIERETRTVMLANAKREYVFKTVDPAVVPQERSEPKRGLIIVVATMLGGMLSIIIVFIRIFLQNDKEPEAKRSQ